MHPPFTAGLSHQSDLDNIHANLSTKPGVIVTWVSGQNKMADVLIDMMVTTLEDVRASVADLGFKVTLLPSTGTSDDELLPDLPAIPCLPEPSGILRSKLLLLVSLCLPKCVIRQIWLSCRR